MSNSVSPEPWFFPNLISQKAAERRNEANELAAEIIAKAEKDARQLLSEARELMQLERSQVFKKAQQEGYREGLIEGQLEKAARAERQAEAFRQRLLDLGQAVETDWEFLLHSLGECVVELAWEVCNKLVGGLERSILPVQEIRSGIEKLVHGREAVVFVHPLDQTVWPKDLPVRIETDQNLRPGDFKIQTPSGDFDGTFDRRLSKVKEMFAEFSE